MRIFYHQILILLFFSSAFSSLGQTRYSAKAALNTSTIHSPVYEYYDLKTGFSLSLKAVRPLVKNVLDIGLETGLSNINSQAHMEFGIFEAVHTVNLDYWSTAFTSSFYLVKGVKLNAGLEYRRLILSRIEWERGNIFGASYIQAPDINSDNWALLLGIEKTFVRTSLGARYYHGLTPVSTAPGQQNVSTFHMLPPEAYLDKIKSGELYITYTLNK